MFVFISTLLSLSLFHWKKKKKTAWTVELTQQKYRLAQVPARIVSKGMFAQQNKIALVCYYWRRWMRGTLSGILVSLACANPQCRWACDDPICQTDCQPVCELPICSYTCATSNALCQAPTCKTICQTALNSSVGDTCPLCETDCKQLTCAPRNAQCQVLCEAPACHWYCAKPKIGASCAAPRCELVCERPACEGPVPVKSTAAVFSKTTFSVLFTGLVYLIVFWIKKKGGPKKTLRFRNGGNRAFCKESLVNLLSVY